MNFLIVTGLSGAGKSMTVNALEDIGFFCIDNIPVALLPRIVDFALQGENQLNRVAVVMDVPGVRSIEQLKEALADLDDKKINYDILFLDANDSVIQRRYKETRRQHPLSVAEKVPISEAIARERKLLQPLRDKAKYVIDTSLLSAAQNRHAGGNYRTAGIYLPVHFTVAVCGTRCACGLNVDRNVSLWCGGQHGRRSD